MSKKKVLFDKGIYSLVAIDRAIKDYRELAHIERIEEEQQMCCIFNKCRYDIDITIKEFCNYVIDIMNSKGKI